jgi:WxL domain surface cell wall-binding
MGESGRFTPLSAKRANPTARRGRKATGPTGSVEPPNERENTVSITRTRVTAVMAVAAATLAIGASPALADNTVTQDVTPGARTASVAVLGLTAAPHQHTGRNSTGTMHLDVDDSTGSNAGWNVTIETSDFVWSAGGGGASSGTDIPAANFTLASADVAVHTAGQAVDVTGGPKVPGASPVGALNSARKTVQANTTFGNGTYTQNLDVSLAIPADSAAGTYTGTLTTTITAAP